MTKTNLITGFLGSGKTTTILHLLANKPADEKWAVLVNEFGEVGIDGALLAESGALLKEIPGGCMCCVNGLPMQVGLNTLLRQGKPDRLLIEPTGLGHPKQILDMLTAAVYEPWIDLRATLCVLDPRQLLDEKAVTNDNFRDQLAAADVIISNKAVALLEWARLAPVGRVKGVMRIAEGLVRINRQQLDLHIETQNVSPPDSRIELIADTETDWNALQASLLRIRLS